MKRFISTVLVLVLVCSLGVSAFADDTPNVDDNPAGRSTSVSEGQVMDTNAGTVTDNSGTVETNNGSVEENNGTVETNNGTVDVNNGTVAVNNETVSCNYGTVEENYGTVTNKTNLDEIGQPAGTVNMDNNYGTVIDVTPEGTTTYFGVVFEETDSNGGSVLKQLISGVMVKLNELFSRSGYTLKGYSRGDSTDVVASTEFTAEAPDTVELIWEAEPAISDTRPNGYSTAVSGEVVRNGSGVEITYPQKYYEAYEGEVTVRARVTMGLTALLSAPGQLIVKIDGIKVDAGNYTVTMKYNGIISVVLSAEFVKTLSTGEHKFTIMCGETSFDTRILVA